MSSDLCFWNRDEEGDQQSPHWRKKETIKESRFFHLYFVDSKGCLFFNLVPPFTTFLKEERAQYVFILSFLMLLQREKSTKNKLLKKWQICSNNNKKKSGSKKLTSVTGVVITTSTFFFSFTILRSSGLSKIDVIHVLCCVCMNGFYYSSLFMK